MSDWFNFYLTALQKIVSTVFDLDLGIGFSLGDIEIALLVLSIVATALIIKSTHLSGVTVGGGSYETKTNTYNSNLKH